MSNEQHPENDGIPPYGFYSKEAEDAIRAAERCLDHSRLKTLLGRVGRFGLSAVMTYGGTTSFFQYQLAIGKEANRSE